jgi:alkyl hydroperoxide reductase subunit AhpF
VSIWANVGPKQDDVRAVEDVVIVGSGPAGYTAALYAARGSFDPLVVEGLSPGGLLQGTDLVENFPGYPKGVLGPQLMADLREQAEDLVNPPMTFEELLDRLARVVPDVAAAVREHLDA